MASSDSGSERRPAAHRDLRKHPRGCEALLGVVGAGVYPAALEFLDEGALAASMGAFPARASSRARFMVIAEADGDTSAVEHELAELREVLRPGAVNVYEPPAAAKLRDFWRWRDGMSLAVEATYGGKVSEDVTVPLDRLEEMVEETIAIGERHQLVACRWGHAGDGNLHSTFSVDPCDPQAIEPRRARRRRPVCRGGPMGGSISGEHGIGWVKRGQPIAPVVSRRRSTYTSAIKQLIDPLDLMNPGKKT